MTRLRRRIETNALKHKPSTRAGMMITGGGYQGKTETACEIAADFEDDWLELHHHLNPGARAGTTTGRKCCCWMTSPGCACTGPMTKTSWT